VAAVKKKSREPEIVLNILCKLPIYKYTFYDVVTRNISFLQSSSSYSSFSGNMRPAPVGVHCLYCNEFSFSVILGQTVQLL